MAKPETQLVNFDVLAEKRQLLESIRHMTGLWEVSIKQRKFTRSLSQNSYYWSAFIPSWLSWLREHYGDPSISAEQAHIALKEAVLGKKELINEKTGQVIEIIPDSHTLDTEEFGVFLDKAAHFLADFAEIIVLPAEVYFDDKGEKKTNVLKYEKKSELRRQLEDSLEMVAKGKG